MGIPIGQEVTLGSYGTPLENEDIPISHEKNAGEDDDDATSPLELCLFFLRWFLFKNFPSEKPPEVFC